MSTPCSIETAINSAAMNDVVTLLGGLPPNPYSTATNLDPPTGVTIHGTSGARPVIETTAPLGLDVTGATLRDVVVEQSANSSYGVLSNGGAVIERVSSSQSSDFYSPCTLGVGDVIRDSVCWYTGTDSLNDTAALKIFGSFPSGAGATTVRNVTAVSSGASAGLQAIRFSGSGTVTATNVVALSGSGPDVRTFQYPGFTGTQSIALDHSNYDSEQEASAADITDAGTGDGNQTTPPVFMDAMSGDFRQQATSTGTIDLGTSAIVNGFGLGALDFEGQARSQGAAADIGADEFPPPASTGPPPSGGGSAPTGSTPASGPTGQRAAALKKCKKRKSARARRNCKKRANKLPV